MTGKFLFVSGLSGAGKSTLVHAALDTLDNCETVLTYTTRPRREGEDDSHEHAFVSDEEYEVLKARSSNWDETIYADHKYGADGAKYAKDLQDGMNIIVPVAPDYKIIQMMSAKYHVEPVTIWIDTDEATAHERIESDSERSSRSETASIKNQFDIIFEPTGDMDADIAAFIQIVSDVIKN
jgi:guanylate kinase